MNAVKSAVKAAWRYRAVRTAAIKIAAVAAVYALIMVAGYANAATTMTYEENGTLTISSDTNTRANVYNSAADDYSYTEGDLPKVLQHPFEGPDVPVCDYLGDGDWTVVTESSGVCSLGPMTRTQCEALSGAEVSTFNCAGGVYTNTTAGSAVCGNSVVESGEQCDDGNATSGDGCSDVCVNEVLSVYDQALSEWPPAVYIAYFLSLAAIILAVVLVSAL